MLANFIFVMLFENVGLYNICALFMIDIQYAAQSELDSDSHQELIGRNTKRHGLR